MKNKLYFPFEVNMINGSKESELIEKMGPKGFGIYIMILTELRHGVNYRCNLSSIKGMARRCKISHTLLKQVIYDSELFNIYQQEDKIIISSPYMNKVMQGYDETIQKNSMAGKKNADKAKRNSKGQFTIGDGTIEENRKEKNKNTTSTTKVVEKQEEQPLIFNSDTNTGTELKSWETYLDLATGDEEWMALLAMNSGISKLFVKHQAAIIDAFRKHVQLLGNESSQQSVADVKAYFANFMRPGTATQKRVADQLNAFEEIARRASGTSFETIDPQTGERNYYGHPIPADAPPRPNDNAAWSPTEHKWI